jgi:hypothetical protein
MGSIILVYNILMDPINPIAGNPEALNPNPQPVSNSNGITILSMAVFILLSLGVIVFLYYQNQQLKSIVSSYQKVQLTPTSVPTSTPMVFETASPSASPKSTKISTPSAKLKACTMDAKVCPNGISVGRTGPNCEFAPCP